MVLKVDESLVSRVAQLSKLKVELGQVEAIAKDLDQFVKVLQEIEKAGELFQGETDESLSNFDLRGFEREDTIHPSLGGPIAVSQAADRSGSVFRVPRFVDS